MVISDESIGGDPNRYAEVRTILNELYYLANGRLLTDALADDDVIAIGDTSQLASTDKLQGMQFDEFVENLTVADMDSEAATDGQVATADGSWWYRLGGCRRWRRSRCYGRRCFGGHGQL